MQFLLDLDAKLFLWINHFAGSSADYIFAWPTFFGTVLLLPFVLFFMLVWDPQKALPRFLAVALAGMSGSLMATLLKNTIHRPRPYQFFNPDIVQDKAVVTTLFQTFISNSFPSGHAAFVFAVAAALNQIYNHKLWFLYPLALLVSLSRIYVGAHFPLDVLAGALSGVAGSYMVTSCVKKFVPSMVNSI